MANSAAARLLAKEWKGICRLGGAGKLADWIDDSALRLAIRKSINGATKTYGYVLPTQILAKLSDPSLDCRSLQAARAKPGSFDARSLAHHVVVPFDERNEGVLGGSQEPYVNNPLRVPELSSTYRAAQRDKEGWDLLCRVVDAVEQRNDRGFTQEIFRQVLTEAYRRLAYPRRASLASTLAAMRAFLGEQSGGDRLLALTSGLFVTIGRRLGLYTEVRRGKITAADQASGMLADLECLAKDGRIVLAVEVKDRQLTISQIRSKLRTMREKQVAEIFFVAQGVRRSEKREIEGFVEQEFASGQNIYVTDLLALASAALSILGEAGRAEFLRETADQMETFRSEIVHRKAWAAILHGM